jgi:hypothetical protein
MIWHYDHRFGTYEGAKIRGEDAYFNNYIIANELTQPWYWVPSVECESRTQEKWDKKWFVGFRDIARSTDERTLIVATFPYSGANHKTPILITEEKWLYAKSSGFCSFGLWKNYQYLQQPSS